MKIKIKNTEQMLSLKLSVYIIRNHMLKWLVGLLTRKNSHVWSLDLILLALCLLIVDKKKKKKDWNGTQSFKNILLDSQSEKIPENPHVGTSLNTVCWTKKA